MLSRHFARIVQGQAKTAKDLVNNNICDCLKTKSMCKNECPRPAPIHVIQMKLL